LGSRAGLFFYRGGYTEYVQQRAERRARALADYEAQQAFIAKQAEYIRRNLAGQNAAQAKGRLRRLNRLERLEKPAQQRALALRLRSSRSGDRVLAARDLVIGYRENGAPRILFRVPELLLLRGERVALIGPNGSGKTTFLKTIIGALPPLSGELTLGAGVRLGYFAQAGEGLRPEHTVLEALLSARPDLTLSQARRVLGQFLFSGDDHFKQVGTLSGGERGRLALAMLALQGANLLLLDEPTNHLDIPAQEALTEALKQFDGTLLIVSHDRYLIAALATQLWVIVQAGQGEGQLVVFNGSYDEWREVRESAGSAPPATEPSKASARSTPTAIPSKNAQQRRQAALAAVEQRIQDLEAQLVILSQQMTQAGNDYARLRALGLAYQETEQALAAAWAEFERLVE
jgi:ATP-binding cassette subfamily F protein 3